MAAPKKKKAAPVFPTVSPQAIATGAMAAGAGLGALLGKLASTTTYRYQRFESQMDDRVCDTCQALEGKEWSSDEGVPEDAQPPIHPRCRCTLIMEQSALPLTESMQVSDAFRDRMRRRESLEVFDSLGWDGRPRS